MGTKLLISCEHGGYRVPARYAARFQGQQRVLRSHRGYDPGSLELAQHFSKGLPAPLYASTVTRLLVELNRSLDHPQLLSEFMRDLEHAAKHELLRRYYWPHRQRVTDWVDQQAHRGTALHVSVHSFTHKLNGETRRADVGLLYDPQRYGEKEFCRIWQRELRQRRPDLLVRRNYPYLGKADGLTTALRRQFSPDRYLGIELEINQRWVKRGGAIWRRLQADLLDSLAAATGQLR